MAAKKPIFSQTFHFTETILSWILLRSFFLRDCQLFSYPRRCKSLKWWNIDQTRNSNSSQILVWSERSMATKGTRRSRPKSPPGNSNGSEEKGARTSPCFTVDEGVTGAESAAAFGRRRGVEGDAHGGRIGHELARQSGAAKVVDLLALAAHPDVRRHPVRTVATAPFQTKKTRKK